MRHPVKMLTLVPKKKKAFKKSQLCNELHAETLNLPEALSYLGMSQNALRHGVWWGVVMLGMMMCS